MGSVVQAAASPANISIPKSKTVDTYQPDLTDNEYLSQLPNPIPPKTPEPPTELPTEPEKPRLETPPTQPMPSPLEEIPGKIRVERFEFVGNTAFSDEELSEAVEPFTGKEITFAELIQAEEAVTNLYIQAGYINSGAVIEASQAFLPEKAVVTITIIEGGIEDIQITGTRRLNPDYVRDRLAVATSKPLNQNRLLEALQLLQLDPLIESISAELSAGVRPDSSLLEVQVAEADYFTLAPFADNGRNPSVGSFRRGARLTVGNLAGFGDSLDASLSNTDGSTALDLSYTIPINPYNGTIRLAGGLSDNEVIDRQFERLDITGDYHYYELTLRQPLFQSPSEEFALGLTLSRQESQNFILGEGFPLSPGANNQGEIRISAIRFFQDWVKRNPQEVFALRSQFSLGVGAFDATVNGEGLPDSRFFAWRGQGQYVRLLAPDTLLVVRSDLQLATDPLLTLEQISIGGLGTVRGYRQDLLLTDNGFLASVEARLPIVRVSEVEGVLQIVPFVDFGVGWNNGDFPDPDPNALVGVGLGLQWQMGDDFSARLDWGIPLVDVDIEKRTWNDNGLYFSLNLNLF
ncbi:ShlB/FhaC/HecB family hemolysin secretion/activation protein [Hydrococcus rivularis]|uniref:ShlB/FhaC/HecB family hemolysin secretion/activation protein n=1 Tax=Hydrococcus rivularis TaxID=1616834 RepID=UPI001FE65B97|nr:ShlB/FhaC/HecB family hemolysin secretion/activation protein [Hydrococcus rivularis]